MLRIFIICINDFEVFRYCWGVRIVEYIFFYINGISISIMVFFYYFFYCSIGSVVLLKEKVLLELLSFKLLDIID